MQYRAHTQLWKAIHSHTWPYRVIHSYTGLPSAIENTALRSPRFICYMKYVPPSCDVLIFRYPASHHNSSVPKRPWISKWWFRRCFTEQNRIEWNAQNWDHFRLLMSGKESNNMNFPNFPKNTWNVLSKTTTCPWVALWNREQTR